MDEDTNKGLSPNDDGTDVDQNDGDGDIQGDGDKAKKGLLNSLKKERKNRQVLQGQVQQLMQEVNGLKGNLTKKQEAKLISDEIEGDDDTPVTKADLRKVETTAEEKIKRAKEEQKNEDQQTTQQRAWTVSIAKARDKYSKYENAGLDFDTVYEAAEQMIMAENNPHLVAYIRSLSDPAEEIYKWGLKDPDLAERKAILGNDKKVTKPKKTDKTGMQSGQGATFYTREMVAKMSEDDVRKNLPAIEESMKRWNSDKK